MKVIIGKRQSGKTTKLIQYASENHCRIVCADCNRVIAIENLARQLGIVIEKPITIEQVMRWRCGKNETYCYDEVFDCFFRLLPPMKSVMATFCYEQGEV